MPKTTEIIELQGLIREIQVGFSSYFGLVLTPEDVSIAQFAVLACLAQERPRKMSEVGKALHVSLPAVTHLVDRLENKKFVRRHSHPTDRRVTLVDMTERGLRLVAKTQGKHLRILTSAFVKHPAGEREAILRFMKSLRLGIRKAVQDVEHES